ncbi:hypothetical protein [Clostridium homopropionicum]|nr:hypothetical protein [Clostridium homopropionicum]
MSLISFIRYKKLFSNLSILPVQSEKKKLLKNAKVIILDNPFAKMTSQHLLKSFLEFAKLFNIQLICFTDVENEAVLSSFNLIYTLSKIKIDSRKELMNPEIISKNINSMSLKNNDFYIDKAETLMFHFQ